MPVASSQYSPHSVFMTADAVGGVWTYAVELARGLDRLGIDVTLAVLGPAPSLSQREQAREIRRLHIIETGLPLDWTASSESALDQVAESLQALAQKASAEIVHLNAPAHAGTTPWPLPLVVAAHSCVATWWRALHQEPLPSDLAWRASRTAAGLAIADAIITPSRSFGRTLAETYGAALPIASVLNARRPANVTIERPRDLVLTTGRLWDRAKDVAVIDEAARISGIAIHAAGPVHGPNGEQADLPHLHLLGTLSEHELAQWYARAAVFVSVSRYEPFGLSVLEAAQAGAALILSDIDTFRELWDGAALFVPVQDGCRLAEGLLQLRSDAGLREHLAERAKARAQGYSPERMVAGTLEVHARAHWAWACRQQAKSAA